VNPTYNEFVEATICEGEEYEFEGEVFLEVGEYNFEYKSVLGCDSIVTLQLFVNPIFSELVEATICEGEEYEFEGEVFTTANEYIFEYKTELGCDSIVILNLIVNPSYNTVLEIGLCEGDTYEFDGALISENGEYMYKGKTEFGCDSIVTLNITFSDLFSQNITADICQGESYEFFGEFYDETGEHSKVISGTGCDTIYTLSLFVHDKFNEYFENVICEGEILEFAGEKLTIGGEYIYELKSIYGCDSIVTLNLVVNPIYNELFEAIICEGEEYEFEGEVFMEAGEYVFEYKTVLGCDSLITINLNVNPIYDQAIEVNICEGEEYEFEGELFMEAGEYVFEHKTVFGCDSITTLNLFVNPIFSEMLEASICEGDNYEFYGEIYTESGEYTYEGLTELGCDSLVTLYLTVDVCESLSELNIDNTIIYPNPTNDYININLGKTYTAIVVSIKDITGKEVFVKEYRDVSMIEKLQISSSKGLYFITLKYNDEAINFKVLKQ